MKKLLSVFACGLLCFGLSACSDKGEDVSVEGTWIGTGDASDTEMTITADEIKFNDGSGGNYEYDQGSDTLILTEGEEKASIKAVLDGDTLTINMSGTDVTFNRK